MKNIKTAEYVSPSHPDKVCDQISDKILDECLKGHKKSRVAVEVMGGHGKIQIMGEITTKADLDYKKIAEEVYVSCGYEKGIDIEVNIKAQSREISKGVDSGGAGDQGIMIGYACNENEFKIPEEHLLARDLIEFIYEFKKTDAKTQVTVSGESVGVIVISAAGILKEDLEDLTYSWIDSDKPFVERMNFKNVEVMANPAGNWSMSGFEADTGLTGRKIVVDSYGPRVPVGGGCFSGKDPTKVDRSGAYMARKIALDYLNSFEGKEVIVKLGYVIGMREPVMKIAAVDGRVLNIEGYDLTPRGIIKNLSLKRPIFEDLARNGHFGRKGLFWELD